MGYQHSVPGYSINERKEWGAQKGRNERSADKRHIWQDARKYDSRICGLYYVKSDGLKLFDKEGNEKPGVEVHLQYGLRLIEQGKVDPVYNEYGRLIGIQQK